MAAFKVTLVTLLLFFCLVHTGSADVSGVDDGVQGSQDSAVLEKLESKIRGLELQIEEKNREIKERENVIAAKDNVIKQKSQNIAALENDISDIRENRKEDAAEQVKKAQARSEELEKLVQKLRNDMFEKDREKEKLEARISDAEKRASELNLKLANLQKIIEDQKIKLQKSDRALLNAEEEMMRAKFEAASKGKELTEVHGAWLPPWLVFKINTYGLILEKNWKLHGKPGLDQLIEKANEKMSQAEEWVAPHVETVKNEWVPAIKEKWVEIATNLEPHVQALNAKAVEGYNVAKGAVTAHVTKLQELTHPHFQEFRKLGRSYIDQVATAAKPRVEKFQITLRPYTQVAVHAYGRFLESASKYHLQVQEKVQKSLKSREITKSLATKELIWFSASALLALPVVLLLKMFSAIFGKKSTRPSRSSHNSRRRGKRGHSDK